LVHQQHTEFIHHFIVKANQMQICFTYSLNSNAIQIIQGGLKKPDLFERW